MTLDGFQGDCFDVIQNWIEGQIWGDPLWGKHFNPEFPSCYFIWVTFCVVMYTHEVTAIQMEA